MAQGTHASMHEMTDRRTPAMSDGEFATLRQIVRRNIGISIADGRRSMMESRLNKRLRALDIPTYKAYIAHLSAHPAEMQELTDRITTNETYFYRTPRIWAHLNDDLIPAHAAITPRRPMRVWSAAASTGEEAHTLGVYLEDTRLKVLGFDYEILGTDISSGVLETARAGAYIGRPVARFRAEQPHLFEKHMRGNEEDGWTAASAIRSRIRFEQHNLMQPLRNTSPFDVVLLRNVLIYFAPEDQAVILRHVRQQMHTDGTLIIGESESLKHIDCDFEQVAPIIYKAAPLGKGRTP